MEPYVDISPIVADLGPDTLAQLPEIVEAVASRTDLARLDLGDRRIGFAHRPAHEIISRPRLRRSCGGVKSRGSR